MKGKKGWFFESRRHKLSALGIKTGRKSYLKKEVLNTLEGNPMFFPKSAEPVKQVAGLKYQPTFDDWLKAHYGLSFEQVKTTSEAYRRHLLDEYRKAMELNYTTSRIKVGDIFMINGQKAVFERTRGEFVILRTAKGVPLEVSKEELQKLPKLGYTPKHKPEEVSKVATDIAVGTGAEVGKYAPLIALTKVRRWSKKQTKKRAKKADYPKSKKEKELDNIVKELVALTRDNKKKTLNYPQHIKEKYPAVTKEITRLSKKHDLKKPNLTYGKNERLATFIPPNTIRLSKRLVEESRPKRVDVAQHEFKHFSDIQKTEIRDIEELEKRAVQFENKTK